MNSKRAALVLNCILLCAFLAFFMLRSREQHPISYPLGTEKSILKVKSSGEETGEELFDALQFQGETLPLETASSTFYLPLDMQEAAWETGAITSGDPKVQLLFLDEIPVDGKKKAIETGQKFAFLAVKDGKYKTYYLTFTGLPVISMTTDADTEAEDFNGSVRFYEAESKTGWVTESDMNTYVRGNTSRLYPKKGYKMTLYKPGQGGSRRSDKRALFGLRRDDEWILYAMYNESTKMRDKLSLDIWNAFGAKDSPFPNAKFGSDLVYVELFINGEYRGLYGLMEPIDSKQLDLTKEGAAKPEEYSYKRKLPKFMDSLEFGEDVAEYEAISGFELKGKHSSVSKEQWQPLIDLCTLMGSSDEVFREQAEDLIDINSAVNTWMYLQIVSGVDNRAKNMYYVAKYVNGSYQFYFAPWDMDLTFGNTLTEGTEYVWDTVFEEDLKECFITWEPGDRIVALDIGGSNEMIREKWESLRAGVLSDEALIEAIDDYASQITASGAYARDYSRWPDSAHSLNYNKLKNYVLDRMEFLDYYMNHVQEYFDADWA